MSTAGRPGRLAAALCLAAAAVAVIGCAEDDRGSATNATTPTPLPRARDEPDPPHRRLVRARCPASAAPGCRSASGRILYVERVDPDGDGDAHFVLLSRESITAPGLTVVDVGRDLRPHPLPGPGESISAAGPVYRGSYGQRQIEAIELRLIR